MQAPLLATRPRAGRLPARPPRRAAPARHAVVRRPLPAAAAARPGDWLPATEGGVDRVPGVKGLPAAARTAAADAASLVADAARLASATAWPAVAAFAAADAGAWCVHRLAHRATNFVAAAALPAVDPAALGPSLWYLAADPAVASFGTGYQWIVLAFFILSFPLTLALRASATAAVAMLAARAVDAESGADTDASAPPKTTPLLNRPAWPLPPLRPRAALADLASVRPALAAALPRIVWTEAAVAVRALPLQALSLLVLPLIFTLPRIVNLLLAPPAASLGGADTDVALANAKDAVAGRRGGLGAAYVALLLGARALAAARAAALAAVSPRVAAGVPELPLLLWAAGAAAAIAVARVLDVLPAAAWVRTQRGRGRRVVV